MASTKLSQEAAKMAAWQKKDFKDRAEKSGLMDFMTNVMQDLMVNELPADKDLMTEYCLKVADCGLSKEQLLQLVAKKETREAKLIERGKQSEMALMDTIEREDYY